ncbi:MAG: hypothetical protein ABSD62_10505 [Candidatus Limnocylindrales bacterium]
MRAADPTTLIDPDGHCWGFCGLPINLNPIDNATTAGTAAASVTSSAVTTAGTAAAAVNVASHIDPSTAAHLALGAATFVPVVGSAAAVADARLYAYEGDYMSAALSLTAVVPDGAIVARGGQALKTLPARYRVIDNSGNNAHSSSHEREAHGASGA